MQGRLRRAIYALFIILLLGNLFYLSFSNKFSFLDKSPLFRIFIYPAYLANKTVYYLSDKKNKLLNLSKAYDELEYEKRQNYILETEISLLKKQIESLETQLNIEKTKKIYPFSIEVTKVIGRNPLLWHQFVIIDGGRDKGFSPGMPVITKEGLVGKIIEVYENSSKVLLLIDQDFACDVRGDKSNILALSSGTGTSIMKLSYVLKFEEFLPGETLVTSGLDNSFPPGIPVGFIVEISKPFGSYFLEAFVMPYVDVLRLKEVMVIKGFKREK